MPPDQPAGRKASPKQDAITRFLRSQITNGTLAPGARLPTRAELEDRFAVSSVTVQRALDALDEHGFICARGTHGTFVAERPPHLSRYAVVFFNQYRADGWLRFYDALLDASTLVAAGTGRELMPFFCSPDVPGERELQRLQRALAAGALAGVIFTSHPYPLARSPALTAPGVARVALMPGSDLPALAKVVYEQEEFLALAFRRFAERGRRRVALMTVPGQFSTTLIDEQLKPHRLKAPAPWRQTIHPTQAPSARACAHLLLHDGQRQRPDALLVSDDNLVEPALAGLADAGVRLGKDVTVVAHANFPTPWTTLPGLHRLGYDARAALATCVELIDTQRSGRMPVKCTSVLPVFEDAVIA